MLDWTDRHCRFFHRLLSQKTLLYSEMVTTGAILHGDRERLLGFNPVEKPLVLQIGGSDPSDLAASSRIGQDYGYDEINLNVGCPSDRVQKGRFGACLMLEPQTVAEGIRAMREAVTIPVTVKTRLGVDEHDSYEELVAFIGEVAEAGCKTFIIHARKAWLKGLSPRENREVPPLRYDMAARLKGDFPELAFILNGGIETLDHAIGHLNQFEGVMLGRAAYHDPYLLAEVDRRVFGWIVILRVGKRWLKPCCPISKRPWLRGSDFTGSPVTCWDFFTVSMAVGSGGGDWGRRPSVPMPEPAMSWRFWRPDVLRPERQKQDSGYNYCLSIE